MTLRIHRVPGLQAIPELDRLLKAGRRAFLIGGEPERLDADLPAADEIQETLNLASVFDAVRWMKDRRAELSEDGVEFDDELIGVWTREIQDKGELSLHRDPRGKALKEVAIGEVDVAHAWQIPAAVGYGGWNACPEAVVQTAMFRRWEEKYGAEIRGLGFDTIECVVSRPPQTQERAMELAWEQFLFCEDIVTQGVGTISDLGATLIRSPYWFFWWD